MAASLIFVAFSLFALIGGGHAQRSRRYLVYPDGGPARTQFIIGLGIPVDLKEQSVTVGTVIKFQYDLPTNSSEYTSRIYGFASTVSRDMNGNVPDDGSESSDNSKSLKENKGLSNDQTENDDENSLVDITFDNKKKKRSLVYTEAGTLISNEVDGTDVPLDEAIRRQEIKDAKTKYMEDIDNQEKRINRWDLYKILERMVERYGFTGRPCLLRTICEAAEVPFTHDSGLLAEIGHILFTPSTTRDKPTHNSDNEYHAAEQLGKQQDVNCEILFPECESSILETFTEIGLNTLHSFGLD